MIAQEREHVTRVLSRRALRVLHLDGDELASTLDDEVDLPGADTANPETLAGEAERSRHIRRALMNLSHNDRTVLVLRHFSECSYQEIADILEIDEKTVKSRLFEARHRLRDALKDFRPA